MNIHNRLLLETLLFISAGFRLARSRSMVWFMAALPMIAQGATVTVTLTGHVVTATDNYGNLFTTTGKPTPLDGLPFTLIFTFDDALATPYIGPPCGGGMLYYSQSSGTEISPTAILTIDGKPFTVGGGGMGEVAGSWYALKYAAVPCSDYPTGAASYSVSAIYNSGGYNGTTRVTSLALEGASVFPASDSNFGSDYAWWSPLPTTATDSSREFGFYIIYAYASVPDRESPGDYNVNVSGSLALETLTVSGPQPTDPLDKLLGPRCNTNMCTAPTSCPCVGDPITVATGNKFEAVTDYATAGQNKLSFTRYYNSLGKPDLPGGGQNGTWRSTYSRSIQNSSATSVAAHRADGQILPFNLSGGVWASDSDVDVKLTQAGGTWILTDTDDTVETYTGAIANIGGLAVPYGRLASIQSRNGYTQTLAYDANNALLSVADSYGRTLSFTHDGSGNLQTVTTPDGTTITYGYSAQNQLVTATYSTTPATTQTYVYENPVVPFALTGIIDENGNRFASWTYDNLSRGLTSQLGTGADLTTIAYDDTTGNRTVTNALGQQEIYQFTTLQNVPKVTEIDRLATATTAAATRKFTYDANGYIATATDWNGNLTTYVNDIHGRPTTTVEASGTPQARTTTISYHPALHLPLSIVTPGLSGAFTYDASGELLTRTLTDTTVTIAPYSTNGTARTWTYTWGNFLLASVKGPRTEVAQLTTFAYDASGALTSVTNALGQNTNITAHTGGGLPLTVVDPNGVTTNLTYNPRQWLLTSTLSTGAGPLTTTLTYDAAGNLIKTMLPDGSALTNSYDTAHRLTTVTDLFNQSVRLTLDANGDPTETDILNSASAAQRKHFGDYDALGRTLKDIGGVGQTTAYSFDANGNSLTVTDPLARVTQQAFDPLNRLIRVIDAAGGITKAAYDAHDRPVTVVDPNSGSTTFVYDGFGDVIQRMSPDTGKTVYRYDLAGNLTQSVDATGATANYTYDALNRPLTTSYPADAAENVAYTYDQAGHGFGIGRLTSVTDAAGSQSRSYDERGNRLTEMRIHGAATLLTSNTYDRASRFASITYPSGWKATYTRDAMGRITAANATSPGGATQSILSGVTYEPFGPVNALTYGNGVAEMRGYDLDYRLLNLSDTGTAALQNLTYSYDAANNVLKITDGVTAANTQNLGYDVLDHLTGATGNYGSLSYSYSPIGNRLTQTSGGVLSNYAYAPHSNQLASINTGGATQTVNTTAAGNISSFAPALGPVTSLTYNQANRLATASSGAAQLAQYAYDAFGQRIVKVGSITATTLYQYDQAGHLLEDADGTGPARVDYVYLDGRPVATIQPSNGRIYFLHDDRLGTPQLASDASQTVQWSATYQPFGYTSTGVGVIVQDLRLPGQEFDGETGLYHNGFRDYVPGLGRYIESDPIGLAGGMNTYAYVRSNPLTHIDPFGLVDVNFENPSDPAYLGSNNWNPNDWFTFAGHGNVKDPNYISSVGIGGEQQGLTPKYYSVDQVGNAILAKWDRKKPIYALVCDANSSGFDANLAQYLANQIRTPVTIYGGNGTVTTHTTEWPIFGGPMSPSTVTPDPSTWPPQTRYPQTPLRQ